MCGEVNRVCSTLNDHTLSIIFTINSNLPLDDHFRGRAAALVRSRTIGQQNNRLNNPNNNPDDKNYRAAIHRAHVIRKEVAS